MRNATKTDLNKHTHNRKTIINYLLIIFLSLLINICTPNYRLPQFIVKHTLS
jgi:hypothetical protein